VNSLDVLPLDVLWCFACTKKSSQKTLTNYSNLMQTVISAWEAAIIGKINIDSCNELTEMCH